MCANASRISEGMLSLHLRVLRKLGEEGTLFDRVHQQRREVAHAPVRAVLRPETSRHTVRSQAASFPRIQATLTVDNEDVLFPSVCKIAWEKTGTSGPATVCSL